MEAKKVKKSIKPKGFTNLHNLRHHFNTEEKCRLYLVKTRWNGQPVCPDCGSADHYFIQTRKQYRCKACNKSYNVLTGTIFENTKIPLIKWFQAIYLATSHKKGISSVQLSKDIGVTQKSAWFILGRIRELVKEKAPVMLQDVVEIDETFVGGKEKNRHQSVRARKKREGTYIPEKAIVLGLVQRNGKVINKVVPDTKRETLFKVIQEHVQEGSTMVTDDLKAYRRLPELGYNHDFVAHSLHEYGRGSIHTNTIEGYWSNLKRGIIGIYHQVSHKHLHRYCSEFSFRYNNRGLKEAERFTAALKQTEGTRLKYAALIDKPNKKKAKA